MNKIFARLSALFAISMVGVGALQGSDNEKQNYDGWDPGRRFLNETRLYINEEYYPVVQTYQTMKLLQQKTIYKNLTTKQLVFGAMETKSEPDWIQQAGLIFAAFLGSSNVQKILLDKEIGNLLENGYNANQLFYCAIPTIEHIVNHSTTDLMSAPLFNAQGTLLAVPFVSYLQLISTKNGKVLAQYDCEDPIKKIKFSKSNKELKLTVGDSDENLKKIPISLTSLSRKLVYSVKETDLNILSNFQSPTSDNIIEKWNSRDTTSSSSSLSSSSDSHPYSFNIPIANEPFYHLVTDNPGFTTIRDKISKEPIYGALVWSQIKQMYPSTSCKAALSPGNFWGATTTSKTTALWDLYKQFKSLLFFFLELMKQRQDKNKTFIIPKGSFGEKAFDQLDKPIQTWLVEACNVQRKK